MCHVNMKTIMLYLLLVMLVSALCVYNSLGYNLTQSEADLHEHLFKHYNPDIVPRLNISAPIWVDVEFYLLAVDDVDEKKQTISARAFLEVVWTDELMTWDAANYSGVTTINVKNEAIWLPDLSLSGTLDKLLDIGQDGGRAIVDSTGRVIMWPYKLYTIACKIIVTKFPKDEQRCMFDFLSWTNPTTTIRLRNPSGKIKLSHLVESGEWEAVSLETNTRASDFGSLHWDHLEFYLLLRRKWLFYAMNSMAPVVCISLLNVLCFLLPAQSGERVTLCISIFLTLAVFLTVINNTMPETSEEVAVFGVYIGLQLMGSALTIFTTVLSIYFFHKDDKYTVPFPLRCLTRLTCVMSRADPQKHKDSVIKDEINDNTKSNGHTIHYTDSENTNITPTPAITWKMASIALDRLCLTSALCWHLSLILYLAVQLNQ